MPYTSIVIKNDPLGTAATIQEGDGEAVALADADVSDMTGNLTISSAIFNGELVIEVEDENGDLNLMNYAVAQSLLMGAKFGDRINFQKNEMKQVVDQITSNNNLLTGLNADATQTILTGWPSFQSLGAYTGWVSSKYRFDPINPDDPESAYFRNTVQISGVLPDTIIQAGSDVVIGTSWTRPFVNIDSTGFHNPINYPKDVNGNEIIGNLFRSEEAWATEDFSLVSAPFITRNGQMGVINVYRNSETNTYEYHAFPMTSLTTPVPPFSAAQIQNRDFQKYGPDAVNATENLFNALDANSSMSKDEFIAFVETVRGYDGYQYTYNNATTYSPAPMQTVNLSATENVPSTQTAKEALVASKGWTDGTLVKFLKTQSDNTVATSYYRVVGQGLEPIASTPKAFFLSSPGDILIQTSKDKVDQLTKTSQGQQVFMQKALSDYDSIFGLCTNTMLRFFDAIKSILNSF